MPKRRRLCAAIEAHGSESRAWGLRSRTLVRSLAASRHRPRQGKVVMPGPRIPAGECQFAKSAMADERRALNVLGSSIMAKWPTPDMITTSIPYRLVAAESVGYKGELIRRTGTRRHELDPNGETKENQGYRSDKDERTKHCSLPVVVSPTCLLILSTS